MVAVALSAGACSHGPEAERTGAPATALNSRPSGPGRSGVPTTECTAQLTTHYIERMTEPGLVATATEVWNANLTNCTQALADFPQTVGVGAGECTQIALATDNPGYDVLATPAPPLEDVITQAGPGC